jgi:hypothetical protein
MPRQRVENRDRQWGWFSFIFHWPSSLRRCPALCIQLRWLWHPLLARPTTACSVNSIYKLALFVQPSSRIAVAGILDILIKCCGLDHRIGHSRARSHSQLREVTRHSTMIKAHWVSPSDRIMTTGFQIPALSQINKNSICGVLRPSASVCPTSRRKRRSGSQGAFYDSICFQPDGRVQSEPLELPHHDRLDLVRLVGGRHD